MSPRTPAARRRAERWHGRATERVDRAFEQLRDHEGAGHECPLCELELYRAIVQLFAEGLASGALRYDRDAGEAAT